MSMHVHVHVRVCASFINSIFVCYSVSGWARQKAEERLSGDSETAASEETDS